MPDESDSHSELEPETSPVAKPGPHPHESEDIRYWAGSDRDLPEGVKPFGSRPNEGE